VTLKTAYIYDFTTKLLRQEAEITQNNKNADVRSIGQSEAVHRKFKRLKLSGGQTCNRSSD